MIKRLCLLSLLFLVACQPKPHNLITIGFLDFVEDETLKQAKDGFYKAIRDKGYDEKKVNIVYRNAQGDQPALLQACDYFISQNADIIAANTTLSTITAVQRTKTIPVCMMVAPRPDLAKLTNDKGEAPGNLFGVYETLEYIDTSLTLVKKLMPQAKIIGMIYNQSEPQSVDALSRLQKDAKVLGFTLIAMPVNTSADTQLITEAILNKKVDAFFALPDNIVFASFETIEKSCKQHKVPIFTSEAGLVKRGALAAYGADMYQWGYQAGVQAADFLQTHKLPKAEIVKIRKRVYNPSVAKEYNLSPDNTFQAL